MADEGLWFTREGVEQDPALGRWELWFRPVHGPERRHGTFPSDVQAQAVADALNGLSRILPHTERQADGDEGEPEVGQVW
jgi:hypothetical protein